MNALEKVCNNMQTRQRDLATLRKTWVSDNKNRENKKQWKLNKKFDK